MPELDLPRIVGDVHAALLARADRHASGLAAYGLTASGPQPSGDRAVHEKGYLKSELVHLGVGQPGIREEVRVLDRTLPKVAGLQLLAVAEALHATGIHDLRAVGIGVLERRQKALGETDLPGLIDLVRRSPGWAYVDWLATKVVGPVVARCDPETEARLLMGWAVDPDLWVRRTALLAPLERLRHGGGDFLLWAEYAAPMLDEKDFFIRKALGWVLREVGRKRPELLFAFFQAHGDRIKGLTRREAAKHTPEFKPVGRQAGGVE